jgi:murein DD-endopeptidase MepM/ murein hydrolase activator NlpD
MPPDSAAAADLLTRLLTDDRFRAEFRRDPAAAARAEGLDDVADELADPGGRAFQTLEIRESKSSLAGVLLAAAAEGVGMAELIAHLRADGAEDRFVAAGALSRAMPAVHQQGGPQVLDAAGDVVPAGMADSHGAPVCPLCLLKDPNAPPSMAKCAACGAPAPLGSTLCPVCRSEGRQAPRPRLFSHPEGRGADDAGGDVAEAMARAPVAPVQPTVQPIDPSLMDNTNAGGKLHGSEFNVRDAEGAPGPNGNIHAGYDFFAKENAPIRSPISGTIVEVRQSRGTSGQIFGGTVKVQGADGKVWVFRHVTPGSVQVGQTVTAGTQIAQVSPWTDGPEHTHIEVWKTFSGGYNATNMEDPLPYLQQLYGPGGQAAQVPVAGIGGVPGGQVVPAVQGLPPAVQPGAPGVPVVVQPGVQGVPVAVQPGVPVAAPVAVRPEDVLANPRVITAPEVQADLASKDLDPRALPMLATLAQKYQIGVSGVETGDGTSRLIISSVNGRPVEPGNVEARDLAQALADLDPSARPSEVGTPWRIKGMGFYHEPEMRNRIEIAYREGEVIAPAQAPAPVAAPVQVPAPGQVPQPVPVPAPVQVPVQAPAAVPPPVQVPAPAGVPAASSLPPPTPVPSPDAVPGAGGSGAAADVLAQLAPGDAAMAQQIDQWIAAKNPGAPLAGYGAVFVREGKANGIDPRLLAAIARAETSLGSDPGAIGIHNAFGWGVNRPFPSWEDNISTVAKGLKSGYIDQGLDTIDEIQKKYCPVGAANDPRGVNVNWLRNVRLLYGELGGNPDASVALGGGPAPQIVSEIPAAGQVPPAISPLPQPAPVPPPVQAPPVQVPQVQAPPVQPQVQAPPTPVAEGPPSEGRASGVFGVATPAEQAQAQGGGGAGPADASAGRASGVFGAAPDPAAKAPAAGAAPGQAVVQGQPVLQQQVVQGPGVAQPQFQQLAVQGQQPGVVQQAVGQQQAVVPAPRGGPPVEPSSGSRFLPDPSDPYPGDADKARLAQWMARQAQKAGLPPELPVMAGLVESGLSNLNHGDRDSLGFFQMRTSIWDQGEYKGYANTPELQLKWFISQAQGIKQKRLADGFSSFGTDPSAYGRWCADVENCQEDLRYKYQLRLDEARQLIWGKAAGS